MISRLVLDTNVVLDLVVFQDATVEPLRAAIEAKRVTLVTNPACLAELKRVLAYPAFELDSILQNEAFSWIKTRSVCIVQPPAQNHLPRCRDPDDQKFLDLALVANASYLVTKDNALLELGTRMFKMAGVTIATPKLLVGRLAA